MPRSRPIAAEPVALNPAFTGRASGGEYSGGRFDFDDGGGYCGGWEDGKAHGHGVCTGLQNVGEYAGSWNYGFEVSGVYTWPSGSQYQGQWQRGKRHGMGIEKRGRWLYRGEWSHGAKGRYGVRQSATSLGKYEGTWHTGIQDGYGTETYADGSTYRGQYQTGLRHGYGVRESAQFGRASNIKDDAALRGSTTSLRDAGPANKLVNRDRKVDHGRGGFILRVRSDEASVRPAQDKSRIISAFKGMKIRRQKSTGDIQTGRPSGSMRSTASSASWMSQDSDRSAVTVADGPDEGSNASFCIEDEQLDPTTTETFAGEWIEDKRQGFGVCQRSDGLKYEGEWFQNKKNGYGVTFFKDGTKEEGKYKNNVLVSSKRKYLMMVRTAKFKDRIAQALHQAHRCAKMGRQKEDISISRTATAKGHAEEADMAAKHAVEDCDMARVYCKKQDPTFHQPGLVETTRILLPDPMKSSAVASTTMREPSIRSAPTESIASEFLRDEHEISMAEVPGYTNEPIGAHNNMVTSRSKRRTSVGSHFGNEPRNQHAEPVQPARNMERGRAAAKGPKPRRREGQSASSSMNDRFDHYNRPPSRPPSRDRSVDRHLSRGQTPVPAELINPRSRAPSANRAPAQDWTPDSGMYEDELGMGGSRGGSRMPSRPSSALRGEMLPQTGNGTIPGSPYFIPGNQQEAESIIRQRACGQEITPIMTPMGSVKRTESLYINPVVRRQAQVQSSPPATALKRKKSLPESNPHVPKKPLMSREEASVLSSNQRETIRRNAEESERYRANPLRYLTSPTVQDWFSKQRLVVFILFVNVTLAFMFFKLLS